MWGTATLARRLLAAEALQPRLATAFLDLNPKVRGRKIAGRPVLRLADLRGHPKLIVIASWTFREEICAQVHTGLGPPNEVVQPYNPKK